MMNFINSIPQSIDWMLVGAIAPVLLYFIIDIIRMVVINIKGRKEKEEDEDNSPCPLCGEMAKPCDKEGDNYSYKCPRCGTQWREVR